MNLFSFKKQKNPVIRKKPKLFIFFVLILVIISIFPVFARPREAKAISKSVFKTGTISDESTTGNCPVDKMPFWFGYQVSKLPSDDSSPAEFDVGTDDEILVNLSIRPDVNYSISEAERQKLLKIQENCMSVVANKGIQFYLNLGPRVGEKSAYAIKLDENIFGANTFGVSFPKFRIPWSGSGLNTENIPLKLSVSNNGANRVEYYTLYGRLKKGHFGTDDSAIVPFGSAGEGGDSTQTRKLEDIKIKIENGGNGGLKDKYRVLWDEPKTAFQQIKFGTNGVEAVNMDWAGPNNSLVVNQYFELSDKDDYLGPTLTPKFLHIRSGINYAPGVNSKNIGCETSRWSANDCTKVIFTDKKDSQTGNLGRESMSIDRLSKDKPFDPTIFQKAWQDKVTKGSSGKLGTVEFAYIPIIYGDNDRDGFTTEDIGVVLNKNQAKFSVEVYGSEQDLIDACKADGLGDDICGSETGRRYAVGKDVSVTLGTNETPEAGLKQTLYGFLIDLWSQITIIMTQAIYQIFAFFIVPVLTALLNVKPYQDAFVNIIYPGWLILRNLANIFFIIALLVVGLRILFQQSAASTARSFIMRLVIMALLVNFSLVIAQGVVGIADTVQSQFLPSGSEVVKALGTKLMVDPIQSFRTAVTNSETGTITSDSFSDLAKPMVLLMLAVAAFFAFIAIAAFLAVRLVALMILYMVSPIAYVGYVMDESSGAASKWWHEFLRYAFMTPILVFFLNIAALVATATSSNIGNVITIGDSIADDLVMGGLTIITHFIVILILFAGMKFAMSFSAASSKSVTKKITDFAQNGFKKTFTKPLGWAGSAAKSAGMAGKDASGNALSGFLGKKGYKKSAALVSALTNPKLTKNELTDRLFTQPKAKQLKDLASRRAGLMEFASNVGNNKWQATKMAAWKLQGKDGEHFRDQAKDLRSIMTDEERVEAGKSLKDAKANLEEVERRKGSKDKNVTKEQAELYKNSLDNSIKATKKEKDTEINKLMDAKGAATAVGNKERVREIESKINDTQKGYTDRIAKLTKDRDDVDSRIKALPEGAGKNDLLQMADADSVGEVLRVNADKIDADIKDFKGKLENDTVLRKTYGFDGPIDEAKKDLIIKEAERLESIASKREFPQGAGEVAARIAKEHEEAKKFDGVDDIDNLKIALEEALRKNNIPSATALLKKLAKEGASASVLNEAGFNNNAEGLIDYMEEKLKNVSYAVRMQITSEFSDIAGKNGNRGLKNATSIDKDQVIRPNTLKQQEKKLEDSSGKIPLTKRKIGDITYQDQNGKEIFIPGEFEDINDSSANAISKLGTKVAKHIWNTADKNGKVFRPEVQNALKRVANIPEK